jgi:hypothetical protein
VPARRIENFDRAAQKLRTSAESRPHGLVHRAPTPATVAAVRSNLRNRIEIVVYYRQSGMPSERKNC